MLLGAVVTFPFMLVVDPWHWLDDDGHVPTHDARLRKRILRILQFIEYGGPLGVHEARETLIECAQRQARKPCSGLMWVMKTPEERIIAYCSSCDHDEALIHNWRETEWAAGPMEPVAVDGETLH